MNRQKSSQLPVLDALIGEHAVLLRCLGKAQTRCSDLVAQQQAQIARLEGQCIQLRAQLVMQISAQAWQIDLVAPAPLSHKAGRAALEASVTRAAAEAALCQSGCIAQGHRWRAQDACLRQGGDCLLVGEYDAKPSSQPPQMPVGLAQTRAP